MEKVMIPIMMSNHHVLLSKDAADTLFGEGFEFTNTKDIGAGEFVTGETITIAGPKGTIDQVRVMGPVRKITQAEILYSDCFKLGVEAPLRDSGDLEGAATLKLIGPKGSVEVPCGIIAQRHVHIASVISEPLGIQDKQMVSIRVGGERGLVYDNVLARVHVGKSALVHIDIEEGNAAGLRNRDMGELII